MSIELLLSSLKLIDLWFLAVMLSFKTSSSSIVDEFRSFLFSSDDE